LLKYPFGGTRLDDRTAAFSEQRRFTGHEFDAGTGLNYMDARYQAPTLSRFLSEAHTAKSKLWLLYLTYINRIHRCI
jgi:RHS repeat-associated protein